MNDIKILLKTPWRLYKKYILQHSEGGGTTNSADYCYTLWLIILSRIYKSGLKKHPKTILELGPGKSLGTGIAGLISGANKYYALDVTKFADTKKDLKIFNQLVKKFRRQEPTDKTWPFPDFILNRKKLTKLLNKKRLQNIQKAILSQNSGLGEIQIDYFAPWENAKIIKDGSIDFIFSQATLEHIKNLDFAYSAMHQWLKPGGYMYHLIDFSSHDICREWNGHWRYSDWVWKICRYHINRKPYSSHIKLLKKYNFKIVFLLKGSRKSAIKRSALAKSFRKLSNQDLTTNNVFLIAKKK